MVKKKKKKRNRQTLRAGPLEPPEDKELVRKHLTVDEYRDIVALAERSPRDSALIRIIYECALRREEPGVLLLSYARDLSHTGRLYVQRGKGSPSGHVDLDRETQRCLVRWIEIAYPEKSDWTGDKFIFPGGRGSKRGLTGRTVYNVYRGLALEAGIEGKYLLHPHVLKRSRAQHLIESMVDRGLTPWHALQAIAALIGHASAKTTIEHYLVQSSKERAMAKEIVRGIYG